MKALTSSKLRRRGFTLVELLVVIGIIAILIAVLLPALKRVKDQANSVKCMSGMRQVMIGLMMYTNDNKGARPLHPLINEKVSTTGKNAPYMYFMAENAPSGAGVIRYDAGVLWPYILKGANKSPVVATSVAASGRDVTTLYQLMNCPSDAANQFREVQWGNVQGQASAMRNFSYSWNNLFRDQVRKMDAIFQRSHKIIMIEEVAPNDGACFILYDKYHDADDEPAFRHNQKGNYGFADFHVESKSLQDLGFANFRKARGSAGPGKQDPAKQYYYFNLRADNNSRF